jgi:hypothetical protein
MPQPLRKVPVEPETSFDLDGFSGSIERGLCLPLAALRAALESLESELDHLGHETVALPGALDVLERATRIAFAVRDFAATPELRPLRSSLREIASDVRRGLPEDSNSHVLIALPSNEDQPFTVDTPLLSRALQRLAHAALDAGAERVLLSLRFDHDGAVFTLLDDACPHRGAPAASASLQHALAERDLEVLGGTLEESSTESGSRCLRVVLRPTALVEATQ